MVASMNPFSRDVAPRSASPTNGGAQVRPTEPSIMNPLMIGTMKGPRRDFLALHGFSDHQRAK